ncbi:hypothetical protein TthSNM66_16050 [Thermus thermophilus]|nr:hypothetical protein TthSNM66_16050 [Thermus thermophilus]
MPWASATSFRGTALGALRPISTRARRPYWAFVDTHMPPVYPKSGYFPPENAVLRKARPKRRAWARTTLAPLGQSRRKEA